MMLYKKKAIEWGVANRPLLGQNGKVVFFFKRLLTIVYNTIMLTTAPIWSMLALIYYGITKEIGWITGNLKIFDAKYQGHNEALKASRSEILDKYVAVLHTMLILNNKATVDTLERR